MDLFQQDGRRTAITNYETARDDFFWSVLYAASG